MWRSRDYRARLQTQSRGSLTTCRSLPTSCGLMRRTLFSQASSLSRPLLLPVSVGSHSSIPHSHILCPIPTLISHSSLSHSPSHIYSLNTFSLPYSCFASYNFGHHTPIPILLCPFLFFHTPVPILWYTPFLSCRTPILLPHTPHAHSHSSWMQDSVFSVVSTGRLSNRAARLSQVRHTRT